jgi:hypothetical protein
VARPEGLEPPTLCLEGRRSFQLSYGRIHFILKHFGGDQKRRLDWFNAPPIAVLSTWLPVVTFWGPVPLPLFNFETTMSRLKIQAAQQLGVGHV